MLIKATFLKDELTETLIHNKHNKSLQSALFIVVFKHLLFVTELKACSNMKSTCSIDWLLFNIFLHGRSFWCTSMHAHVLNLNQSNHVLSVSSPFTERVGSWGTKPLRLMSEWNTSALLAEYCMLPTRSETLWNITWCNDKMLKGNVIELYFCFGLFLCGSLYHKLN